MSEQKIKKGQYEFLKPYWDPISNEAKDFIRRMLVVDPKQRADIKDLMDDKWLSMEKTEAMAAKLNIGSEMGKNQAALKKLKGSFFAASFAKLHAED